MFIMYTYSYLTYTSDKLPIVSIEECSRKYSTVVFGDFDGSDDVTIQFFIAVRDFLLSIRT